MNHESMGCDCSKNLRRMRALRVRVVVALECAVVIQDVDRLAAAQSSLAEQHRAVLERLVRTFKQASLWLGRAAQRLANLGEGAPDYVKSALHRRFAGWRRIGRWRRQRRESGGRKQAPG